MPTYKFYDSTTNSEYEEFMSISELDGYLSKNINLTQLINGAPAIGDSIRLGLRKPDSAFRDKLREIKKAHSKGFTKSTINTF